VFEGQSAALAQTLVSGEPCPVCGSKEHPNPTISDIPIPTEDEINQCRDTLKKLEFERGKASKELVVGQI